MKIKGIGPSLNIPGAVKNTVNSKSSEKTDKVEISSEAKKLKELSAQKLEKVQQKINSGFYNSDEVLKKVADAVLKDLK